MTNKQLNKLLNFMMVSPSRPLERPITVNEFKKLIKNGELRVWRNCGRKTFTFFAELFNVKTKFTEDKFWK